MLHSMTENDLYESAQLLSADTLGLLGGGGKAIDRDRIQLVGQIGQGNFGKVFKGKLSSCLKLSYKGEFSLRIP